MYEFTVFKKPNAETPQWQLRHNGILVAAARLGQGYTTKLEGIVVSVAVSHRLWATVSKGHEISPALQPKDVLQPGKDTVHNAYEVDDLGIGVDQGWVKTAISLRHEKQLKPGGNITTSRHE